ncbi:MAG: hypothetical protein Q7R87_00380 [Nanoarchaeota archaeon]|nr:hypothetical protein [Nanoarchaeota archaeon]
MFAGKEVRILLKGQARESFIALKQRTDKEAQTLLNSINQKIELLKANPQYGDALKKNLIPKELEREGIKNLYRVELSNFWRMLYTIEGNKVEIFLFILTITDHPTYDKILGYKKK